MTKEQFGDLIIQSTDSLYRISKTILKEDADCEDAVSQAIVIGFARLDTLLQDQYAKTWLTRILINECYRILRQRKRETVYDETVDVREIYENDYSLLYQNIMELDVDYRTAVTLYYMEGYTIKEIAKMQNCPEGTIKSRLARARTKLRDLFGTEVKYAE